MLGCRAAGAGFVHAAASHQRHDGQHLGRGAQLHDREQVGQVVAQYVAGHRDGVLAADHALHGYADGFVVAHHADVQAGQVVILEVQLDLLLQLAVVGALRVQPEDRRGVGLTSAGNCQLDPVANRRVLGLAGAPDVAGFDLVLHQHGAVGGDDAHGAVGGHFEGLVVGTVFFGLLRHQADVWHGAHGGRVERTIGFAEVDHFLIDASVGALRHDGLGVFLLAVLAPHLTGVADHCRHRGVDDDVARNVQVGDALDRVDHGHFRAMGVDLVDVMQDFFLLRGWQRLDLVVDAADTVVRVDAQFLEQIAVLVEHVLVVNADGVAEDDRVGDLHHGRLDVQGPHHAGFLAVLQGLLEEVTQLAAAHEHAVEHFAFLQGELFLDLDLAVLADELDAHVTGLGHGDRLLAGEEVAAAHVVGVGLRSHAPLAHAVRVLAGIGLDRGRGAAVGVAFAQNRVHGAAQDLGVAAANFFVFVVLRIFREVRNVIALSLQLGDGCLELRYGGADVRQFDDVGVRLQGQLGQFGQVVIDALVGVQAVGKACQDPSSKRDVAGFNGDVSRGGKGFYNWQKRIGSEGRSFVGEGVDDLRRGGHLGLTLFFAERA